MTHSNKEISELREELSSLKKRLDKLESQNGGSSENDLFFEEFYLAFENKYRGEKSEIKERTRPYIDIYRDLIKDPKRPVLDLGCGRGEWIELLSENGFPNTHGIDGNSVMVKSCVDSGLNASQADIFDYLATAPNDTYGAISAMHVIEHIPFKKLISLFQEVYRCLAPGGIALFETPNPRNVFVGACSFHFDPTHIKPVPAELSSFLGEYIGFELRGIRYATPHPDITKEELEKPSLSKLWHESFAIGLDYGLILKKPE